MMEFRVIYHTTVWGDGWGSPYEPFVAYFGRDHSEARKVYEDTSRAMKDSKHTWTVELATREVTDWTVAQTTDRIREMLERDGAVR